MKQGTGLVKIGVGCVVIALFAGCASSKHDNGTSKRGGSGERQLNVAWAGKPYKDLVAVYGEPTTVMENPNYTNTKVVVYRDHEKLSSNCAHAFTITNAGVPTVVNYFCR